MSIFAPAPEPKTALGRLRILAPTAAVRVSPLCLGAMNFGDAWKEFMGECNKETTFEMLDYFYESGGNFVDTANNYQNEDSENWIGEWMEKKGVRDQMVIATKFTTNYRSYAEGKEKVQVANYGGNSSKSVALSVEASLKKLKTTYIDLLYVHWWDYTTSVEELMQSLNFLVQNGKVLYLGASDMPAWVVAKCNQYARDHGLKQFSVYQGLWSASERAFEAEILPLCEADGMSVAPWGALGRGQFKTAEQRQNDKKEGRQMGGPTERDVKVSEVLEKVAKEHDTLVTSVAMAYVRQTSPYRVFPIVGGRNVKHLKGNIEALTLQLSNDDMKQIQAAAGYEFPFPSGMLFRGHPNISHTLGAKDVFLTKSTVHLDVPPHPSDVLHA